MRNLQFLLYVGAFFFAGCKDVVIEEGTITYLVNEPVFMSASAFRGSVNVTTKAESISNYGKICFYHDYIYISEAEKGIHIINNIDPSNPQNIGFIELIGNADLAIRNDILYADSFIDLVWFDVSNPEKPILKGRLENVFPDALPMPQNVYRTDYSLVNSNSGGAKGVVVGWEVKERTDTYSYFYEIEKRKGAPEAVLTIREATATGLGSAGSSGVNGSMSRFSLYQDYLYYVMYNYMSIIDLGGEKPEKVVENINLGFEVETIFSYKDYMYMGTPTGMLIYSVANPLNPEFVRAVWHILGCDPVVVENDIAYVTIHSGNACGQTNNDLMIYDVSDPSDPKHIVTYAMKSPKGLGIDNTTLFVCDDGLKIFDASDPQTLMAKRLAHYWGMDGYDVIPFDNVLMMIADDGLYQYDYSDLTNIRQLSMLPIERYNLTTD